MPVFKAYNRGIIIKPPLREGFADDDTARADGLIKAECFQICAARNRANFGVHHIIKIGFVGVDDAFAKAACYCSFDVNIRMVLRQKTKSCCHAISGKFFRAFD